MGWTWKGLGEAVHREPGSAVPQDGHVLGTECCTNCHPVPQCLGDLLLGGLGVSPAKLCVLGAQGLLGLQ